MKKTPFGQEMRLIQGNPNAHVLKYGQDDMKDIRVHAEAAIRVSEIIKKSPHTILVPQGWIFKKRLQEAFKASDDRFEQNINIVENKSVPVNCMVLMNKDGEPLDVIEIEWELNDGIETCKRDVESLS